MGGAYVQPSNHVVRPVFLTFLAMKASCSLLRKAADHCTPRHHESTNKSGGCPALLRLDVKVETQEEKAPVSAGSG